MGAAHWVRVVQLPGDAPDRKPLGHGGQYRKHAEFATGCRTDPRYLRQEPRTTAARVRHSSRIRYGCVRHAGDRLWRFMHGSVVPDKSVTGL
jgi:hypothetical protein